MKRLFISFLVACTGLTVHAQQSLCLDAPSQGAPIDLRPDELNSYLQLDQFKVILFGEHHNEVFDPEIKYHLITDLNKRTGLRHVFLENSASNAWRLNQYLRTGDTAQLYNPAWPRAYDAYTLLWRRLYAYNQTLPDSLKLVIHGVDFERADVFQALKILAPDGTAIPPKLQPVMDTINAHRSEPPLRMWSMVDGKFTLTDNTPFIKTLRYVQEQLLANPADVKSYFGSNYAVVREIAENEGRVEVRPNRRNRTMMAAMRRAIREQGIDRFIGFFGAQHTRYSVSGSISNGVRNLPGIRARDVLNIAEMAYDVNDTDTAFRVKHFHEIVAMNGSCRATILPAAKVPGFRSAADFVVIANITK